MNAAARAVALSLPALAGLVVLIVWLAGGADRPWIKGWRVALPLLATVPVWAIAASRMRAVHLGKARWCGPAQGPDAGFPATALVATLCVIFTWSLCFTNDDVVTKPRVCEYMPGECHGGKLSRDKDSCKSMDVARLTVANHAQQAGVDVSVRSHDCWECLPSRVGQVGYGEHEHVGVDAQYRTDIIVTAGAAKEVVFRSSYHFGDQGEYLLNLTAGGGRIDEVTKPWIAAGPLLSTIAVLIGGQAIYVAANWWADRAAEGGADQPLLGDAARRPQNKMRLQGLDVFRGMSLCVMNLANYGGGGYWFLNHSVWDGLTIADLVFPWFIWIMGVAMALALEGRRVREDRAGAFIHVVRRGAILVLIAMFLDSRGMDSFARVRVPGVLQRFGISYFVVAAAILGIPKPEYSEPPAAAAAGAEGGAADARLSQQLPAGDAGLQHEEDGAERAVAAAAPAPRSPWVPRWSGVRLWLPACAAEAPLFVGLAVLWLGLTFGITPHGADGYKCPKGYVGPGGASQGGAHYSCTGGVARWLDELVFGPHGWVTYKGKDYGGCFPCRRYQHYDVPSLTCRSMPHHEPEGLLGSLNSIVLCWLGLVVGRILRPKQTPPHQKAASLILLGSLLCLVAGALCEFKQFGGAVPVNKNLWSTSFIFCLAGTGTLALCLTTLLVDWAGVWSGKPFMFIGMNSILYYSTHEILSGFVPFSPPDDAVSTHTTGMLHVALGVATNVIIVYWLWRNKVFFKI